MRLNHLEFWMDSWDMTMVLIAGEVGGAEIERGKLNDSLRESMGKA